MPKRSRTTSTKKRAESARPAPGVVVVDHRKTLRIPRQRLLRAVAAAFRLVGVPRDLPVHFVFVDDRTIRTLHRQHLGLDHPTDVLSFELSDVHRADPDGLPLGEIVVSTQTAERLAHARGHPPSDELLLYAVHGLLHLLGFDDHDAADVAAMRSAERHCLSAAGVRRDLFHGEEQSVPARRRPRRKR